MRLQMSPAEAQKVLDKLDANPTDELKHVRARLADGLATAAKSKTLDPDELHALIAACMFCLNQPHPQATKLHEQLNSAIPKLEAILRNQRPAGTGT